MSDKDAGDVVVGYWYYVGMHFSLCHGPIDFVSQIRVDEKIAWQGEAEDTTITIDAPDLFGGEDREGGIEGDVDIMLGKSDQERNWYLEHNVDGGDAEGDFDAHDVPAYRGTVSAVLNRVNIGLNPYMKAWDFRAQRIHTRGNGLTQWYDAKAAIPTPCSGEASVEYDRNDFIVILPNSVFLHEERPLELQAMREGTVEFIKWARAKYAPQFASGGKWDGYTVTDGSGPYYMWFEVGHYSWAGSTYYILPTASDEEFDTFYNWILNKPLGRSYCIRDEAEELVCCPNDYVQAMRTSRLGRRFATPNDLYSSYYSAYTLYFDDPNPIPYAGCVDARAENTAEALGIIDLAVEGEGVDLHYKSINVNYLTTAYSSQLDNVTGEVTHVLPDADDIKQLLIDMHEQNYTGDNEGDKSIADTNPLDMNPAHIIRECLTDRFWGMGYSELDIDDTSFTSCADTLYTERMGISLLWDRQVPLEDFVLEILKHINGVLYISRTTGNFVLKLIRDDYNIEELLLIDRYSIKSVSDNKRITIGELVNSVTVEFWDTCLGADDSVTIQDQALISMQGNEINTTIQYPGFTNLPIATKAALRDLQTLSTPLLSCTLETNRIASDLNIGDVFVMDWPDLEVNAIVMRIVGMSFGDGRDNKITLNVVEDSFAYPGIATVEYSENDPSWSDPSRSPAPILLSMLAEAPYYGLVLALGQREIDAVLADVEETGYAVSAAVNPNNAINATMYADAGGGYKQVAKLSFCGYAITTESVDQKDLTVGVENVTGISYINTGTWAQIEDELIRVDAVTSSLLTMGRAVLDTSPRDHSVGKQVFFWQERHGADRTEYVSGEELDIKLCAVTGKGEFPLLEASTSEITLNQRAFRPYPPADLKIDGVAYPTGIITSATITVSWVHRDRLQQTSGALYDHTDAGIGPEAGTTYTLKIFDSSGVAQITHTGITGLSRVVTISTLAARGEYTLNVWAVRDTIDSWQSCQFVFANGLFGVIDPAIELGGYSDYGFIHGYSSLKQHSELTSTFDFDYEQQFILAQQSELSETGDFIVPAISSTKWRINITSVQSQTRAKLSYVEFRTALGGGQSASGGTVLYSSQFFNFEAYKAYWTSHTNGWLTDTGFPQYIGYEFSSEVAIAEVSIGVYSYDNAYAPKNFTIDYWDGSSWVTLVTVSNEPAWAGNTTKVYPVQEAPALYTEILKSQPRSFWTLGSPSGTNNAKNVIYDYDLSDSTRYDGDYGKTSIIAGDSGTSFGSATDKGLKVSGLGTKLMNDFTVSVMTIECWFNIVSLSSHQVLYKSGTRSQGQALGIYNSNFRFAVNANYVDFSTSGFSVGDIVHIVGIDRATGIELYVNGVSRGTTTYAHTPHPGGPYNVNVCSTASVNASTYESPLNNTGGGSLIGLFTGQISHTAVYSVELTAARILAHYNAGKE